MSSVAAVLTALSDPTRRELLERLSVHGNATATMLAGELPITRQAIVQHLGVLDVAGLVAAKRTGRERRFEIRTQPLTEVASWLDGLAKEWDGRLQRIKQIAEMDPSS